MTDRHQDRMNLANRITVFRILLAPVFIFSILYYKEEGLFSFLPATIFGIAVFSDAVDGFVARRFNQKTELGTILDPIADKLLLISAFACLSMVRTLPAALRMPAWLPVIVISRDAIIVLGAVIIHMMTGKIKITPSPLGKITTFFQMMTVMSTLLRFPFLPVLCGITALFTLTSGIDYVRRGSRLLNQATVKPT